MAYRQKQIKEKPWQANVGINGKRHFLGYFATKAEAEAVEAAFRVQNGRPADPRKAQQAGLPLGVQIAHDSAHRFHRPILDIHPCFECPLADCDDTSKLCALRVIFNKGQNAMRHKRPMDPLFKRKYNIARSELAAIHKENLSDG